MQEEKRWLVSAIFFDKIRKIEKILRFDIFCFIKNKEKYRKTIRIISKKYSAICIKIDVKICVQYTKGFGMIKIIWKIDKMSRFAV